MNIPAVDRNIPGSGDATDRLKGFFTALSGFGRRTDPDGFPIDSDRALFGILTGSSENELSSVTLSQLRQECWRQFRVNPFVSTATRDSVDALVGDGFRVWSKIPEISRIIKREYFDVRNRMWHRTRQIVTGYEVTGETFVALTCDPTERFVHIDYVEGTNIDGIDEYGHGIISHPDKTRMPLFYHVRNPKTGDYTLVPSINIAYNPSLLEIAEKQDGYDKDKVEPYRTSDKKFAGIGGFRTFIIDREADIVCTRNISHLWGVLIWANFYTLLKSIEIDHKRSLASFLWKVTPTDENAWENWNRLSDEDKKKTGLFGKKSPGSTIILPFGFTLDATYPQLTNISGADNDIREMLVAGLKQPMDVVTGNPEGKNFGSVKASRGPWSDRILSGQYHFTNWQIHDFWRPILFLFQSLHGLPREFEVREAVGYDENRKPVFENVPKDAWECIELTLPLFSSGNLADLRNLFLGSKPAGLSEIFGVSHGTILRKLGIPDFHGERLKRETEMAMYPGTMPEGMSGEQFQEAQLAIPPNPGNTESER